MLLENIMINFVPSFQLPNEQRKPHLKQGFVVPWISLRTLGKGELLTCGWLWLVSFNESAGTTSQPTDHVFLIASAADTFQPAPEKSIRIHFVFHDSNAPCTRTDAITSEGTGHYSLNLAGTYCYCKPRLKESKFTVTWRRKKGLTWCKSALKCERDIQTATLHLLWFPNVWNT